MLKLNAHLKEQNVRFLYKRNENWILVKQVYDLSIILIGKKVFFTI